MTAPTATRETQPQPGPGRKVLETVHQLFAGLWLGALAMSIITAGILFTTMRTLEPEFGKFAAYAGDQSNIGAGFIQNRVFLAGDIVQYVAATATLATTIAMLVFCRFPLRRVSSGVRLFALGAAVLLTSYQLFVLRPRMADNVRAYWAAAEAGNSDAAEAARDAFNADHPAASNAMGGTALAVAVLLGAGAWSAASAGERERPAGARSGSASGLEEPGLSRGRGPV